MSAVAGQPGTTGYRIQQQQQQQQQQNPAVAGPSVQPISAAALPPALQQHSLPSVLHYLQFEWRRFERERNMWEIERTDLKSRIAFLEGERYALDNLRSDLLRRVKMLEYALRQERSKFLQLQQQSQQLPKQSNDVQDQKPSATPINESPQAVPTLQAVSDTEYVQVVPGNSSIPTTGTNSAAGTDNANTASVLNADGSKQSDLTSATGTANNTPTTATIPAASGPPAAPNNSLLSFSKGFGNTRSRELLKSYLKEADALLASTVFAARVPKRSSVIGSVESGNDSFSFIQSIGVSESGATDTFETTSSLGLHGGAGATSSSTMHRRSFMDTTRPRMSSSIAKPRSAGTLRTSLSGPSSGNTGPTVPSSAASAASATTTATTGSGEHEQGTSVHSKEGSGSERNSATLRPSKTAPNSIPSTSSDTDNSDQNKTLRRGSDLRVDVNQVGAPRVADSVQSSVTANGTHKDIVIAPQDSTKLDKINSGTRVQAGRQDQGGWQLRYTLLGHLDSVRDVAFHPQDPAVFSASEDRTVKLWSLRRGNSSNLNGDGSTGLTGTGADIDPVHTYRGHTDAVLCLAASEDGETLYSAGCDATIRVWRVPSLDRPPYSTHDASLRLHTYIGHSDAIWCLRLHPLYQYRSLLASVSSDGTVKLWDATRETSALRTTLRYHSIGNGATSGVGMASDEYETPTSADWVHGDSNHLAVAYRNCVVKVFDAETGAEVLKCNSGQTFDRTPGTQINAVVCHPTSPLLMTAHEDGHIRFNDLKSGKNTHSMMAHADGVSSLAVAPMGGVMLVSGGHDGALRWWDLATHRSLEERVGAHGRVGDEGVMSVRVSGGWMSGNASGSVGGEHVGSGGADGVVRVWGASGATP